MAIHNLKHRIFLANVLVFALIFTTHILCFAAKKKDKAKDKKYIMTEIELQSELMSYADRFASILISAFEEFDASKPPPEIRHVIMGDTVHSLSAAFTIAADRNPQTALLDMVVLATLGRIIYEDNMRRKYGTAIEVMAKGYGQMETDIWGIAAKVLVEEQQEELRQLILKWREKNPEQVVFNYVRFSGFAAQPRTSTLVKRGKAGGLFKSIRQVTEEVGETRMLAERGLFLGTRLPLLTGYFGEIWMSQMIVNPEAQKILTDVHSFSSVSERLANIAEQLPDKIMDQVAIERKAAIDQLMDRLVGERKIAFEELKAEEQQIKGLVSQLRLALAEGNNLLVSATALTEKLNLDLGEPADAEESNTIEKLTTLVEETNRLVNSVGLEELLPQLIKAIDDVERESEELVEHSFRQGILLIVIGMVAFIIAKLVYNYLNKRLIESSG